MPRHHLQRAFASLLVAAKLHHLQLLPNLHPSCVFAHLVEFAHQSIQWLGDGDVANDVVSTHLILDLDFGHRDDHEKLASFLSPSSASLLLQCSPMSVHHGGK
eukprot:EG_transcript_31051